MKIDWNKFLMSRPDPYWRAAKISARLLQKPRWSKRDLRIASIFSKEAGVSNRLIDQATAFLNGRKRND